MKLKNKNQTDAFCKFMKSEIVLGKSQSNNSAGSVEIEVSRFEVISAVKEDLPIAVNTDEPEGNIDTRLNNRLLSLRNCKTNVV